MLKLISQSVRQTRRKSIVLEALKRDMAELSPRHIPSSEQNALKDRQDKEGHGKKRSASESPKFNGKSKTRVKPRIIPGQKTDEGLERNRTGEKRKRRKNLIRKEEGLVQQQLPLRSLMEKATPRWC